MCKSTEYRVQNTEYSVQGCNGLYIWLHCAVINVTSQDYYEETGASLTRTTDQTIESAHQWMAKLMQRSNYVVKDLTSPRHGKMMVKGEKLIKLK